MDIGLVLQADPPASTFVDLMARAEDQGYTAGTAVLVGSVFATLFQLGGAFSILGGLAGDRLQRRTPRGRALVASIGSP